jgi:hypothetical protein
VCMCVTAKGSRMDEWLGYTARREQDAFQTPLSEFP